MHVEKLLTERDHVLVAFDGPVAELRATTPLAGRLRTMLGEAPLPRKVARTDDPFVVLAYAATIGPGTERAVYAQFCRLEAEAVAAARLAPGVGEAFTHLAAAGTQITVIGSLATSAIRTFLVVHGLDAPVRHLAGRTGPDQALLPPAPDLITAAIHAQAVPTQSCLFVGSTNDDVTAARTAGVDAIRYHRPVVSPDADVPAEPTRSWFEALETGPVAARPRRF